MERDVRRPIEPFWGKGRIESVNLGRRRHMPKEPVDLLTLIPGHGVWEDAHAGEFRLHAVKEPIRPNTREVSLIDAGVLDAFRRLGFDVGPGTLGENVTVRGIPLDAMAPGDRLYCGSLVLVVTENRIPCTTLPAVDHRLLKEMMGRSGLLAYVLRGDTIHKGMQVFAERAVLPEPVREELASRVVDAAKAAFGGALLGVALAGPAVAGGFVPGYSEVDVHLLLDESAMEGPRTPKLEHVLRLQEGLAAIERERCRVQGIRVHPGRFDEYPAEWVPPPGTFACVFGAYPEAWDRPDPDLLRVRAGRHLERLASLQEKEARSFAGGLDADLPRVVRRLGERLERTLRAAAVCRGYDPAQVWNVRPLELVQWCRRKGLAMEASWRFLTGIGEWEIARTDPAALRALWRDGMKGLGDIETWVRSEVSA